MASTLERSASKLEVVLPGDLGRVAKDQGSDLGFHTKFPQDRSQTTPEAVPAAPRQRRADQPFPYMLLGAVEVDRFPAVRQVPAQRSDHRQPDIVAGFRFPMHTHGLAVEVLGAQRFDFRPSRAEHRLDADDYCGLTAGEQGAKLFHFVERVCAVLTVIDVAHVPDAGSEKDGLL